MIAQLARLLNKQKHLPLLPPPHRVNSAPPAHTNVALANQLPSAVVFTAATMRHFLVGDVGNSANTAGARHGARWDGAAAAAWGGCSWSLRARRERLGKAFPPRISRQLVAELETLQTNQEEEEEESLSNEERLQALALLWKVRNHIYSLLWTL